MKIHSFRHAHDFKANPSRAVARRVLWRLRWMLLPHRPVVLRQWWHEMDIALPKSASAATVYYSRCSYSPIIEVMQDVLSEGMVFLDIGAHAGEYTLIAASLVGDAGMVHAIEPQPQLVPFIRGNIARNHLLRVSVHACAMSDHSGTVNFFFHRHSMGGWTSAAANTTVPAVSLDDFVTQAADGAVDFIKLDAGGNELAVLRGGQETLRSLSPMIIYKLYHPDVIRERHGYDIRTAVDMLRRYNYTLDLLDAPGAQPRQPLETVERMTEYFWRSDIYNYDFCLLATPPRFKNRRRGSRDAVEDNGSQS